MRDYLKFKLNIFKATTVGSFALNLLTNNTKIKKKNKKKRGSK